MSNLLNGPIFIGFTMKEIHIIIGDVLENNSEIMKIFAVMSIIWMKFVKHCQSK